MDIDAQPFAGASPKSVAKRMLSANAVLFAVIPSGLPSAVRNIAKSTTLESAKTLGSIIPVLSKIAYAWRPMTVVDILVPFPLRFESTVVYVQCTESSVVPSGM